MSWDHRTHVDKCRTRSLDHGVTSVDAKTLLAFHMNFRKVSMNNNELSRHEIYSTIFHRVSVQLSWNKRRIYDLSCVINIAGLGLREKNPETLGTKLCVRSNRYEKLHRLYKSRNRSSFHTFTRQKNMIMRHRKVVFKFRNSVNLVTS